MVLKFEAKKNLEHYNTYNVQGINKSTPKTYLMFLCTVPKPLLTLIHNKYSIENNYFLMKFTNVKKKFVNGIILIINGYLSLFKILLFCILIG